MHRNIEKAKSQIMQKIEQYFAELERKAQAEAIKIDTEVPNSESFRRVKQLVEADTVKLDRDIITMQSNQFIPVLKEYDTREPNKKYDHTSFEVSEFIKNINRNRIDVMIDEKGIQALNPLLEKTVMLSVSNKAGTMAFPLVPVNFSRPGVGVPAVANTPAPLPNLLPSI